MPHQEALGRRASAAIASKHDGIDSLHFIDLYFIQYCSISCDEIKPFLAMTYFFCRVLIFKDHGKSAKEITC
jgi:hypothetical protein